MCGFTSTNSNSQGNRHYRGKNMLGTNTWIDIERVYDMTRSKSANITTHMQVDKIEVDFGFMTNAGDLCI